MTEHIVVGIDDTTGSRAALAWAMREADLRHATLEVVHVYLDDDYFDRTKIETRFQAMVDAAKAGVGASVDPTVTIVFGESAPHGLVHASGTADLLVVGASRHLSLVDRMLGSVSAASVHQAQCTVVVVRTNE